MKEMKKIERYTDREWEQLASALSDENGEQTNLLNRFMAEDNKNSGKMWKDLKNASDQEVIDVDKAWNNVKSKLMEDAPEVRVIPMRTNFFRTTFFRIAAVALVLLSLGSVALYMNNEGLLSRKITVLAGNDQKNVLVALPDGSKIYLNRNSEFSYRKNFGVRGRGCKTHRGSFLRNCSR